MKFIFATQANVFGGRGVTCGSSLRFLVCIDIRESTSSSFTIYCFILFAHGIDNDWILKQLVVLLPCDLYLSSFPLKASKCSVIVIYAFNETLRLFCSRRRLWIKSNAKCQVTKRRHERSIILAPAIGLNHREISPNSGSLQLYQVVKAGTSSATEFLS